MFTTIEGVQTDVSKIDLSCIGDDFLNELYSFQQTGIQLVIKNVYIFFRTTIEFIYLDLEYQKRVAVC